MKKIKHSIVYKACDSLHHYGYGDVMELGVIPIDTGFDTGPNGAWYLTQSLDFKKKDEHLIRINVYKEINNLKGINE